MKTRAANYAFLLLLIVILLVAGQMPLAHCSPDVLYLKNYAVSDSPEPSPTGQEMNWYAPTEATAASYVFDDITDIKHWYTRRYTGTLAVGDYVITLYASGVSTSPATTYYATTSGGDAANPANVEGAPDNLYANVAGSALNQYVWGSGFDIGTGSINKVEIATEYNYIQKKTEMFTLEYKILSVTGATSTVLPEASVDTQQFLDVTADRAWTWTDVSDLEVHVRTSTSHPQGADCNVDACFVRVTVTTAKLDFEVARTSPDGLTVNTITSTTAVYIVNGENTITIGTGAETSFTDERLRLKINWNAGSSTILWDGTSEPSQLSTPSGSPPIPEFPSFDGSQMIVLIVNLIGIAFFLKRFKKAGEKKNDAQLNR